MQCGSSRGNNSEFSKDVEREIEGKTTIPDKIFR
jgi:hypothetical protein